MSDYEHDDAESNRRERDDVRDTEAKRHPLIDSEEFDAESQDPSCDEVPPQHCRIGHATSAPLYQYPSEQSESDRLVQLRRMYWNRGRR